jgi:hypothetical protein
VLLLCCAPDQSNLHFVTICHFSCLPHLVLKLKLVLLFLCESLGGSCTLCCKSSEMIYIGLAPCLVWDLNLANSVFVPMSDILENNVPMSLAPCLVWHLNLAISEFVPSWRTW